MSTSRIFQPSDYAFEPHPAAPEYIHAADFLVTVSRRLAGGIAKTIDNRSLADLPYEADEFVYLVDGQWTLRWNASQATTFGGDLAVVEKGFIGSTTGFFYCLYVEVPQLNAGPWLGNASFRRFGKDEIPFQKQPSARSEVFPLLTQGVDANFSVTLLRGDAVAARSPHGIESVTYVARGAVHLAAFTTDLDVQDNELLQRELRFEGNDSGMAKQGAVIYVGADDNLEVKGNGLLVHLALA
ncbi:MAG: hypothetical protein WEB00_00635 [Dehalococcoidia bacterium]